MYPREKRQWKAWLLLPPPSACAVHLRSTPKANPHSPRPSRGPHHEPRARLNVRILASLNRDARARWGGLGVEGVMARQAWRSVGYRLLLTIACSFGPGAALTNTNIAAVIGAGIVQLQVLGHFGFLLSIFLFTSLLSCLCSNAATVVAFYSVLRAVQVPGLRSRPSSMHLHALSHASHARPPVPRCAPPADARTARRSWPRLAACWHVRSRRRMERGGEGLAALTP